MVGNSPDGLATHTIRHTVPVREQEEAVGHAVRAVYLYAGMTDIARITQDEPFTVPVKNYGIIWSAVRCISQAV